MVKKYRAAVVGCGRVGFLGDIKPTSWALRMKPATHFGAFRAHPRIELAGVCDPVADFDSIKQLAPEVPVFKEAENLLKVVQPEIVSVAVPNISHRETVELAAENGAKLIICEKPIAENMEEARAITDVCRKNNVILLVNHMRRFDPMLSELRQKVAAGYFGVVRQARMLYVNGLFNNGTHAVDLLRWYLGEVTAVQGQRNYRHSCAVSGDYNIDGFLEMESGVRVAFQSCEQKDHYIFDFEFFGSKQTLFLRDLGLSAEIVSLDRRIVQKLGADRSFFSSMADHAVACLDGKAKPASTGEDALETLKVLLAIRKSAENNGQRIQLQPPKT